MNKSLRKETTWPPFAVSGLALNSEIDSQIREAHYAERRESDERQAADGHLGGQPGCTACRAVPASGRWRVTPDTDEMHMRYRLRFGRIRFATDAFS